jgi:hypothetical protein
MKLYVLYLHVAIKLQVISPWRIKGELVPADLRRSHASPHFRVSLATLDASQIKSLRAPILAGDAVFQTRPRVHNYVRVPQTEHFHSCFPSKRDTLELSTRSATAIKSGARVRSHG